MFVTFINDGLCQQIEDENICLKHPGNLIIGNPYDCYSFFACQHGNAIKVICPNNSIFNPKLENCDPTYSDCIISEKDATLNGMPENKELLSEDIAHDDEVEVVTDSDDLSDVDTEDTDTDTEMLDPTTPLFLDSTTIADCETCTTDPLNVQCPSNDTEVPSFLPSDSFCDSFYLCYHGKPFEMFCPVGYHFSQERQICILERESSCTDSSVGNKVPKCPLNGQFFIPHFERCNLFYYCENGIRSIQQCTAFKQWDVIEKTCKLDFTAKCIKTIPRSQRAKYYKL